MYVCFLQYIYIYILFFVLKTMLHANTFSFRFLEEPFVIISKGKTLALCTGKMGSISAFESLGLSNYSHYSFCMDARKWNIKCAYRRTVKRKLKLTITVRYMHTSSSIQLTRAILFPIIG